MPNNKNSKKLKKVEIKDKRGKVISERLKIVMNEDKFMNFEDLNNVYKKVIKDYDSTNLIVRAQLANGQYTTVKAFGVDIQDLKYSEEDYLSKFNQSKSTMNLYDKFVTMEMTFTMPNMNG